MNRSEIEQLIPHRAPFLWLDEIIERGEKRIQARKRIEPELDLFQGHYPHFPVLPGVILCEATFQAGAVLIASTAEVPAGQIPVVTRLNNVQFRRMVRPGDTIDIEVELTEKLANAWFMTGKVSVAGKVATRCEFACAITAAE